MKMIENFVQCDCLAKINKHVKENIYDLATCVRFYKTRFISFHMHAVMKTIYDVQHHTIVEQSKKYKRNTNHFKIGFL